MEGGNGGATGQFRCKAGVAQSCLCWARGSVGSAMHLGQDEVGSAGRDMLRGAAAITTIAPRLAGLMRRVSRLPRAIQAAGSVMPVLALVG